MVGVEMGDEYLANPEADTEFHHLSLSPLPTVEEEHLAFPLHRHARHVAAHGGTRGRGTQNGDSQQSRSPDAGEADAESPKLHSARGTSTGTGR